MEKQPKQHGKLLPRQVRLDELNMVQIKNRKPISYPNGFLLITKVLLFNKLVRIW